MSIRLGQTYHFQPLPYFKEEVFTASMSMEEIRNLFIEILNNGVHGLCFSLYENGQMPGSKVHIDQVIRRLEILKPHTRWIRSFSTTDSNENIPIEASKMGFKNLVGAWLGKDLKKNEIEIENLIELGKQGYVHIAAVGNEVLYRDDLSLDLLLNYIQRVKKALPEIPVGYVDAYYQFVEHPALVENCDLILTNFYPFWEGTHIDNSLQHLNHMYNITRSVAGNKKIIITESGWPSRGSAFQNAQPSLHNALRYFINTQLWTLDTNIELFYFSSFDEMWKTQAEGDVGASWGIWNANEILKVNEIHIEKQ